MSELCSACSDVLPQDEDFVKCIFGNCKLHYECSGILEKTWRTMGSQRRDNYKCRLCRAAGDSSAASSESESVEKPSKTGKIVKPVAEPMTLDRLFAKFELLEKSLGAGLERQSKMVQNEIGELKNSVQFFSDKLDDFVKEVTELRGKVQDVVKTYNEMAERNCFLENRVQVLETVVEDLQQYGRNCNIQLDGVPEVEGETMMDLVNKLAVAVDEPVVLNMDIQAAHRIPAKDKRRPRPIIVQFSNRQKRDAVMKKAKARKITSTQFVAKSPETPVYVNDHLTPYYKKLLFEAKKVKRERNYAFVWVKGSKIYLRKDQEAKATRISSMKDIERL